MTNDSKAFTISLVILIFGSFFIKIEPLFVNPPVPLLYYDDEMLQTGYRQFYKAANAGTLPEYKSQATVLFTKMNNNLPNSYQVYLNLRGLNIDFRTQTQGAITYSVVVLQMNPTNIKVEGFCNDESKYQFLIFNYLLVHEFMHTNMLMYGTKHVETTHCVGTTPTLAVCQTLPIAFPLDTAGWNYIIFFRMIRLYRDNNVATLPVDVTFSVVIVDAANIKFKLDFGHNGKIEKFGINVIAYKKTLLDSSLKKVLMLQQFQNKSPFTTLVQPTTAGFTPYEISFLPINALSKNFFIGFYRFKTLANTLHTDIYPDLAMKLTGYAYNPSTQVLVKGFIFWGYKCSNPYYFNQISQQCEKCPIKNCLSCVSDLLLNVKCTQCVDLYFISDDKLSCECDKDMVADVCETLIFPDQIGCVNGKRDGTSIQCLFCSRSDFKILSNNKCVCIDGYNDDDEDAICVDTCGDGLVLETQCDDGNLIDGDGCNSQCKIEQNFKCDKSQPSICSTLQMLRYRLGSIKKIPNENKAELILNVKYNKKHLPLPIIRSEFLPELTYLKLFYLSQTTHNYVQIQKMQLKEVDGDYAIHVIFDYEFTIENLQGKIVLDYEKTRYLNDSQQIEFTIEGVDLPLIYTQKLQTYTMISYGMLAITVLNYVAFFASLITPKFIGLETILTLQLIFYSQLLIENPLKWPVGFIYLKYLKFSTGFNQIFQLTDYDTLTLTSKKYSYLQMQKSLIENFNLNFLILFVSFFAFVGIFVFKYKKQDLLQRHQNNRKYNLNLDVENSDPKVLVVQVKKLRNINDKVFWIVNYFAFWSILPLMASFSSEIVIEGNLATINTKSDMENILMNMGSKVGVISLFIILVIGLNHFRNLWLSQQSIKKMDFRPQETNYKRLLFGYLFLVGMLVLIFNQIDILGVPFSIVVLLVQVIYSLLLFVINPYRQSLKIHTVTLLFNQALYITFLVIVNLINLFKDLKEMFIVVFGFLITGLCLVSLVLSFIRLYYQLKFGQALQKQIQRQREKQLLAEQQRKRELYLKKMRDLKNLHQLSDSQKVRAKNRFLFQNQIKQEKAKQIIGWLDQKQWTPQDKQKYFIKNSTYQPLQWLQTHDKEQFEKQLMEKEKAQNQQKQKIERKKGDSDYLKTTQKLKQEVIRNVTTWNRKLQYHEKRIKNDLNYAMDYKKDEKDRYVKLQYTLKQ